MGSSSNQRLKRLLERRLANRVAMRKLLESPDTDEELKDELIRRAKEEIQNCWNKSQEKLRRVGQPNPVETKVVDTAGRVRNNEQF